MSPRFLASTRARTSSASMLLVAFAAFLLIGVPEGVLGTAWPEIRDTVGRPTSDLGVVLIAYTGGYLVSTLASGHVAERIGMGRTLVSAAVLAGLGALLFAITGAWIGVLAGAVLLAMGSGVTDSGLNSYLTLHHDVRAMNLAHALFGVGAALGPLVIELALRGGATWEVVYVGIAVLNGALAGAYLIHRGVLDATPPMVEAEAGDGRDAAMLLVVLLTVFFFYVGTEVSVGAWSFTLLTDGRGVDDTLGRVMVSAFWAGLTVGRFGLGWLGDRLSLPRLLRWSVAGVGVGVGLLWLDPFPGADLLSLPLTGLAMAGIFPALVLLTPGWLGSGRTGRIVGYQLAASSLGAVVAAASIGRVVDVSGEDAIGAALAVGACGLIVAFALLDRLDSEIPDAQQSTGLR